MRFKRLKTTKIISSFSEFFREKHLRTSALVAAFFILGSMTLIDANNLILKLTSFKDLGAN